MSNRKLHGVTTRMLMVPGAAVVKTFDAEVPIEVEDPRDAERDPKLAKVRSHIVSEINSDIATKWRTQRAAGKPPQLDAGDLTWSVVADLKGKQASAVRLRGASTDEIAIPGAPQQMGFFRDVAADVDATTDASRDPKLAKARARLLADINDDIATLWRNRRLPGDPPQVTARDLTFTLR